MSSLIVSHVVGDGESRVRVRVEPTLTLSLLILRPNPKPNQASPTGLRASCCSSPTPSSASHSSSTCHLDTANPWRIRSLGKTAPASSLLGLQRAALSAEMPNHSLARQSDGDTHTHTHEAKPGTLARLRSHTGGGSFFAERAAGCTSGSKAACCACSY